MAIRKYENAVITKFQALMLKSFEDRQNYMCVCASLQMGKVHKILLCGRYIWPNNDDKYCDQDHKIEINFSEIDEKETH